MSIALRREDCDECGALRLAVNERQQLFIVCDCPESERAVKVNKKIPEEWT